ncbi:hypothetical protein WG908_15905 [Sphingobium sp. AN641]|uniref:hypothetical protein n=1 Tax=Sphingobium sp. AN641 TaxID=3133443 RepID=UPI0030C3793F
MLAQLVVAQFDLERAIAELSRTGASTTLADSQLDNLAQLQRQLGTASMATIAAMRGEIGAAVAQAQTVVQQARGTVAGANAGDGADIAVLANHAQAQAASFMRDLRQYDGLLQFDNDSERAAYEQREAERRRRYEEESAKGTAEGKFNASGEALGQMADLAAHGGSADPALMQRMDELAGSLTELRTQYLREGKTAEVEAFDQRRREDLRGIMQSKGLTDAQIDAFLAAHPDPSEATRQFVTEHAAAVTVKDLDALDVSGGTHAKDSFAARTDSVTQQSSSRSADIPVADAIGSAVADLKAMGLVLTQHDAEPAHGVNASSASAAGRIATRT